MAQNVYDRQEFFEGYSQRGRSLHGLAGAAEWPAIRTLLPEFSGSRVVHLGCGFGWFSRHAREALRPTTPAVIALKRMPPSRRQGLSPFPLPFPSG